MFCDLVGSTAMASRLDPEDLREIIGTYHGCVAETVKRFDGFVAKYMGDGVLIYFGYPQAHEDDAERAVRAGLALVDAVGRLDAPDKLRVRVGIATGLAVVGDLLGSGEAQERGIVGETPNMAARMQALAEPNAVVIGPRMQQLLGDLFEYRDLGILEVKGFAEPVHAYCVLRPSAVQSRFEALHGAALTPLTGREEEIELLLRRWRQVASGEGRVALLSGEPGIGKSRLVTAVQEATSDEPHVRLRYFCSPYHQDSALHPIIDQLEHAAGFGRDDTVETKLDKLEALLAPTAAPTEDVALVAELLSLVGALRHPPLNLSPQRKKDRTFEALLRQLESLARNRPVLMVFEDVHWIDPTSRDLLDLVIERVQRLPALLLITFRPEFDPAWTGQPHVALLALSRLDHREGAALARRVAGNKASLSDEFLEEIAERTDGVPLFIEELTKAVLEAGGDVQARQAVSSAPLPVLAVPATLHASLMARLDRLGPVAKEIAQVGAVIGREFPYELLVAVAVMPEPEVRDALTRLTASGLVFQRGMPPQSVYAFKHALVQDAAYGTMLRGRRQELHASIGRIFEEHFPEATETEPERVAQHYTAAGLPEPAVRYWSKAGQRAIARSAIAEALAHLRRGLDLLSGLPDTDRRRQQELELQVALGVALMAAQGWSAPEAGRANARARELCEQIGVTAKLWPVLYGQWVFHGVRAEHDTASALAEELLRRAEGHGDDAAIVVGRRLTGTSAFWRGEPAVAREHMERAIALYDPERHRSLAFLYVQDPRVAALSVLSWGLLVLGYPEQAEARSREAVDAAREMAHHNSQAYALLFAGLVAQCARKDAEARNLAQTLGALAEEQKFPHYVGAATALHGWVLTEAGDVDTGLAQLRQGLAAWLASGAKLYEPYYLALQAEAHGRAGRAREALELLGYARAKADERNERWFEAELHRQTGERLLARSVDDRAEAEGCFRRAMNVARRQNARSWELRAATSLARLWRDQRKQNEARDLLAPIYGWFTEGFDTPDVKEAKALLIELQT